jgi:hypothetical protein
VAACGSGEALTPDAAKMSENRFRKAILYGLSALPRVQLAPVPKGIAITVRKEY